MTIDWWTFGIQTANILVLMGLLGHFFWTPMAAMIETRRAAAQTVLADAETSRANAAAASMEIERTRAEFDRERREILASAHGAAIQATSALLEEAHKEADSIDLAARTDIESAKAATEKDWGDRSAQLAIEIAGRLVGRLDGPAVRAAFLDWLLTEIKALPDQTRNAIVADNTKLDAVTAVPLDGADQAHWRMLVCDALGGHPEIVFKADPSLIAGVELHGPHLVVTSSWRADLTRIRAELMHDI